MNRNSFAGELFSKKELSRAGKFLLSFGVLFLGLNFFSALVPLEWAEFFFAQTSLFFLGFFGLGGKIVFGEPVVLYLDALAQPIAISYLCTGLLEAAVVFSAVISSFGVETRKRLLGAAAGLLAIVFFNVARIVTSIVIIVFFGLDAGEFSHDLLFRAFLFAGIAGYYFLWFQWATGKK